MTTEFERLATSLSVSQDALRTEIQDSGNSLAAMPAEIDDRTRTSPPRDAGAVGERRRFDRRSVIRLRRPRRR